MIIPIVLFLFLLLWELDRCRFYLRKMDENMGGK